MLDPEIIAAESKWAQKVVTNARSILLRNKKIATGNLYKSIRYKIDPNGKIHFLYSKDGKWVTQGRRKGDRFPPPAPISRWIRQKGIRGINKETGKALTNGQLTFLISRAIARDGIKPLPFMKMALVQSIKQLPKDLKPSIVKAEVKKIKNLIRNLKP